MSVSGRRLVGRFSATLSRYAVYTTAEALELHESESFQIRRKRVFYDDIVLVTRHDQRSVVVIVVNLLITSLFWGLSAMFTAISSKGAAVTFACFGLPFALAMVVKLLSPVRVITVFGRRSKIVLRYAFLKGKADKAFDDIIERASAAQPQTVTPMAGPDEQPPAPPAIFEPLMAGETVADRAVEVRSDLSPTDIRPAS